MSQCICNALCHYKSISYHICNVWHIMYHRQLYQKHIISNSSSQCQYIRVHISTFNQQLSPSMSIKRKQRQLGSHDQLWHKRCPQSSPHIQPSQATQTCNLPSIEQPQIHPQDCPNLGHKHAILRPHIRPHTATRQS